MVYNISSSDGRSDFDGHWHHYIKGALKYAWEEGDEWIETTVKGATPPTAFEEFSLADFPMTPEEAQQLRQ